MQHRDWLQPDLQPNVVVLVGARRHVTAQRSAEVHTGDDATGLGGTGWYGGCVTMDQEVGDSSSAGRAAETPVLRGFRRVTFATVQDLTPDFWVVSWSVATDLTYLSRLVTGR